MFAPVGEDQQPTSGAGMSATGPGTEDPRCTKHPEVTLTVHPRRWGWVCPTCRAAGQSTLQTYPFVPLPPVRPAQAVAAELDVRPTPRSAPVPSPRPEPGPWSRSIEPLSLVSSLLRRRRTSVRSLARRKPGVQIPSPPPPQSPGHRPGGSPPPGRRRSRSPCRAAHGQQPRTKRPTAIDRADGERRSSGVCPRCIASHRTRDR